MKLHNVCTPGGEWWLVEVGGWGVGERTSAAPPIWTCRQCGVSDECDQSLGPDIQAGRCSTSSAQEVVQQRIRSLPSTA